MPGYKRQWHIFYILLCNYVTEERIYESREKVYGIIFSEVLLLAILKSFLLSTKLRLSCSGHKWLLPHISYRSMLLFLRISVKDLPPPTPNIEKWLITLFLILTWLPILITCKWECHITCNNHDLFTQLLSFISTVIFSLWQFWFQMAVLVVIGLARYLLNEPVVIMNYKHICWLRVISI